jgi:hypothetical protein
MFVSCFAYSSTLKMGVICSSETSKDFDLSGVTTQMPVLFILIVVRTSNQMKEIISALKIIKYECTSQSECLKCKPQQMSA